MLRLTAGTAIATLAGCLGDDADEPPAAEDPAGSGELGEPTTAVEVSITDMPSPEFVPGIVHLEPGGTVRWVVEGRRHEISAYHPDAYGPQRIPDGAEPWESGLLRESGEFEWTFEAEGIYDYTDTRVLCATHEALGAVGRVVVGWPDPDDEPALDGSTAQLPGRASTVMAEYDERTRELLQRT